jgi:hypothetical protein
MQRCKKLRRVNVSGCPEMSNSSLIQMGRHCPDLAFLDISNCDRITSEGLGGRGVALLSLLSAINPLIWSVASYPCCLRSAGQDQRVYNGQDLSSSSSSPSSSFHRLASCGAVCIVTRNLFTLTEPCILRVRCMTRVRCILRVRCMPFGYVETKGVKRLLVGCKGITSLNMSGCVKVNLTLTRTRTRTRT